MATHKSSITAELKLSGRAKFKSDLGAAEQDAKGAAGRMSAIKPVSIGIDAKGATRQMTMVEEKHRAHRRVIERQEKESAARTAAYQKAGVRGGGGAGGGRFGAAAGGTRNAGMAYNFAQDYIQGGGIRGVANNIPQIAEALIGSPAFAAITATALAAAAAGYTGFDLYKNTGSRFEEGAGNRYAQNKAAANVNNRKRARDEAMAAAGVRGDNAGERQSRFGANIDSEINSKQRRSEYLSTEKQAEAELRRIKIDRIEDVAEKSRAVAEEEKRVMTEEVSAKRQSAEETMRIAAAELASAEARSKAIREELSSQTGAARSPEEINRRIELEKELVGLQTRLNEARARTASAGKGLDDVASQERQLKTEKEIIDEKLKGEEIDRRKQQESDAIEGNKSQAQQIIEIRRMKREADKTLADKEKSKQETRDGLSSDVAMSKMSPRKRAKAEEAAALKSDVDEFRKQGFSKEEAEKMAGDKAGLRKPRTPGRTRGAGYGGDDSKRKSGLGSASYDGLAGLAAMQDDMVSPSAPQERKRIGGAGRDKEKIKDREKQQGDAASGIWNQILAGLKSVEKAVRDTGPASNERGKPLSSVNR